MLVIVADCDDDPVVPVGDHGLVQPVLFVVVLHLGGRRLLLLLATRLPAVTAHLLGRKNNQNLFSHFFSPKNPPELHKNSDTVQLWRYSTL